MSQQYGTPNNFMNTTQPGGMMINQNPIATSNIVPNTYVTNNTNNMTTQPNMIMATPVTTNNQPQIQNQQQNNQNQTNYQQTYIPGRFVNSPDEIGIIEVPMNYPMSIFPKLDRTELYVKYWTEQGVQTETFVRKTPEEPAINASESDILNALNNIMERLSKLENVQQTKSTKKSSNKEEVVNE